MATRKRNQFAGTLDPAQVAAGMNVVGRNAKRLAEDAALLLEHKRFASAAALAVLSIEEAGKTSILRQMASAQTHEEAKPRWREYRSHTKKNVLGAFLDLFTKGARRLDEFGPLFDQDADHPQLLDQLKQIAFYSDCLGEAHWSEPVEVIEEALARSMVMAAQVLAVGKEVTPLEIEPWFPSLVK